MATVVSLTETRINELLSGWVGVELSQDNINALMSELRFLVQANDATLDHFTQVVQPQLVADLAAGKIEVQDLKTNILPALDVQLSESQAALDVLNTSTIPSMQADIATTATVVAESPTVYNQPEAPTNPDNNDRALVVGDVWYDSDQDNLQRIWNGTEWTTFRVDVGDLSVSVKNFVSTRHMIY